MENDPMKPRLTQKPKRISSGLKSLLRSSNSNKAFRSKNASKDRTSLSRSNERLKNHSVASASGEIVGNFNSTLLLS